MRWAQAVGGAIVVALVLSLLGGTAVWRLRARGPLAKARAVVVPQGTTAVVADALARAHVLAEPRVFALMALATQADGPLHAGEFAFPAHASYRDVLDVLRHAAPVEHHVTIPEGLTAKQITRLIEQAPALSGSISIPSEGWILPNTYDYLYGTKRQEIVAEAHAALKATLKKLWAERAPSLPFTTPEQALTLASIVERETAIPAERPLIAAVYINRLARDMPLDADPTVIYAASKGSGELSGPITMADLEAESPYNTYREKGLPPGPIDAPGVASIIAVLHPAQTDDLYFVADGFGGHTFARTLAEQERNIARWHRVLEQQAKVGTR